MCTRTALTGLCWAPVEPCGSPALETTANGGRAASLSTYASTHVRADCAATYRVCTATKRCPDLATKAVLALGPVPRPRGPREHQVTPRLGGQPAVPADVRTGPAAGPGAAGQARRVSPCPALRPQPLLALPWPFKPPPPPFWPRTAGEAAAVPAARRSLGALRCSRRERRPQGREGKRRHLPPRRPGFLPRFLPGAAPALPPPCAAAGPGSARQPPGVPGEQPPPRPAREPAAAGGAAVRRRGAERLRPARRGRGRHGGVGPR